MEDAGRAQEITGNPCYCDDAGFRESGTPCMTCQITEALAAVRAEAEAATWEKAANKVPTSWLDPLLSGSEAVVPRHPLGCQDVERLLQAIRSRLKGGRR